MTEIKIGRSLVNVEALIRNWEHLNLRYAQLEKDLAESREAAASCCDYFAEMLENGAGDYPKGSRLRQAARMIRTGGDKRGYPTKTAKKQRATPKRGDEHG